MIWLSPFLWPLLLIFKNHLASSVQFWQDGVEKEPVAGGRRCMEGSWWSGLGARVQ